MNCPHPCLPSSPLPPAPLPTLGLWPVQNAVVSPPSPKPTDTSRPNWCAAPPMEAGPGNARIAGATPVTAACAACLICRCHGGSTPRQHDPVARYLHELNTGKKLNFPGRPLKHGFYSRLPKVKVSVILANYHGRQVKQVEAERQWIWGQIAGMQAQIAELQSSRQ